MSSNTGTAIRAAKQALRKEIKRRVSLLSPAEKTRQSTIVVQQLLKTSQYQESERISVFLSMHDEIQTGSLLKDMLSSNKKCYIPHYVGSNMEMVRLNSMEDYDSLPETSWKIKQPPDDDVRENALDSGGLDLILVPGLAFTRQGERCGRGKGYYDKYLHRCIEATGKKPHMIAMAFYEQIMDSIPTTPEDFKIDLVLFENIENAIS